MSRSDEKLLDDASCFSLTWEWAYRARPNILAEAASAGLNDHQLEAGDVDALDHIALSGESQISDVAARLVVGPVTATSAVDRLVARGLVSLNVDPVDDGVTRVAFTEAGLAVLAEARDRRMDLAIRVLSHFDADDQKKIVRLLPMIADAIADELGIHTESD